jgi:hypothetical protein
MSIFDDGLDIEEALTLAGAIGFAEESMRAEEDLEEAPEEEIEIDSSEIKEIDLKLIYNMNPGLYRYIANIVRNQKIKWEKDRLAREAVTEELAALEETEAMLETMGPDDDN